MSEHIWLKQEGEPNEWFIRFSTYLQLGPNRTFLDAYRQHVRPARSRKLSQPINISPQWQRAAVKYNWKERAEARDMYLHELQLQEEEEQRRQQIMNSGYALAHNRVLALMVMAQKLNEAVDQGKLFVQKKVGSGPNSTTFEELDAPLVREWRGLLDDLAKETGGRIKIAKTELDATLDIVGAKDALLGKLSRLVGAGEDA